MALEDILRAIERDCDDEVARIAERADGEAERILSEAREEARRLEAERAEGAERRLERDRGIALARARMDAARSLHRARHAIWTRVLDAVREHLAALRDDDAYRDVLAGLVAECLDALPGGARLEVDARDARAVDALLEGAGRELEVEETLDTWGGVVLRDDEGHAVRNSLEDRLEEATRRLRRRVAEAIRDA